MTEKSVGTVVHVSDEYSVVINRGLEDGIEKGEQYLIYNLGQEIFDPSTNESLGQLEIVRGRARVVHVQPQMSTLKTIEVNTIPGKKRIIKRNAASSLHYQLLGYGDTKEEVEDGPIEEIVPLDATVGDFAKPI